MTAGVSAEIEVSLAELLSLLVEDRPALVVRAVKADRSLNWEARSAAPDFGRLIGQDASHKNAARALLDWIGERSGEQWLFDVKAPSNRAAPGASAQRGRGDPFEARTFGQAAHRILAAGFADPFVLESTTDPSGRTAYFTVTPSSRRDLEAFMRARQVDRHRAPINALNAMQTFARAHGRMRAAEIGVALGRASKPAGAL